MRWLLLGVLLVVGGTIGVFLWARGWTPPPPPPLTIAKETTWFTGPLTADGRVDYAAALEAEAQDQRSEEDGAPLLLAALEGFVDVWKFTGVSEDQEPQIDASDAAVEALSTGQLDAPDVAQLLQWLDASAGAMEQARLAAERPRFSLLATGQPLSLSPIAMKYPQFRALMQAFALRIATRTARGEVAAALADVGTAWTLADCVGTPPDFMQQVIALDRQGDLLEQLLRCTRADPALPAERVLAMLDANPPQLVGEIALREALLADRVSTSSKLDDMWHRDPTQYERNAKDLATILRALPHADPNPPFRRLQKTYDELELLLLGGDRPARARIATFRAALDHLIAVGRPIAPQRAGPLGLALLSSDRLAEIGVDELLHDRACPLRKFIETWVIRTARRDQLVAELAARAGAPERRDSWLDEPLVATLRSDGSYHVRGALIELAQEFEARARTSDAGD